VIEPDYFAAKRQQLGMDRQDSLARIQAILEGWYPGQVRVRSLNNGTLRIVTPSAPVAGDLRMRQMELRASVEAILPDQLGVKLQINIGQIEG
jgi:hypothetical protein